MNRRAEAKALREDMTDAELRDAITAWGRACEASRFIGHIDVADVIRNRLIGEKWRRERAAAERASMFE